MKRYLRLSLVFILVLTGGKAFGADYTFTIPVELSTLPPEVNRFHVACWVYAPSWNTIGRQMTNLPSGGNFHGNISVEVNAGPGRNPAELTHYECKGSFTGNVGGQSVHFFSYTSPTFPLAPNAPFVLHIPRTPIR